MVSCSAELACSMLGLVGVGGLATALQHGTYSKVGLHGVMQC